ncbi:MAG TPA: TolC family protein [Candidatus Binatia bacterium]|nr:TolC family protein [Candidatus Binatia bacterium]
MRIRGGICCVLLCCAGVAAHGQVRETFDGLLTQGVRSPKLPGPQHLRDYVRDGKLTLTLNDVVRLTLENNSLVHVNESQVEAAKFSLLQTYHPFDPALQASANLNRYSYPGFSQIQGQGTFDQLTQLGQVMYTQTFQTGTAVQVQFNATRYSTNSGFYFINPYWNSYLNLQFTQPLLRNAWRFANTAPLVIARRNLQQSQAGFQAQVSTAILQAVTQYWTVVRDRGNLRVDQESLDAAQASYQRDKRALELGALSPLDIYRPEAEVAARRVTAIQAEYTVKRAEDTLRMIIGADQDDYIQALDLDLTEKPEPVGELKSIDATSAFQMALAKRPEIQVAQRALENDETSIRLAHNHLLPDLSLTGFYQSTGIGGNEISLATGQPTSTAGLGTSLNQLFGFNFPGYGAALTLNLPIKNRGAQAELGTALVGRHRDLYSAQQIRQQITLDVKNAVHQLEVAKLSLAAGQTALELAQNTLSAEQRKTQLGAENVFFLLDAQTRVASAQAGLLQAQVDYQNAIATLDYATGNLLDGYAVQISDKSTH